MARRWTAAGMLEAEPRFCRIIGYAYLAKLAVAVERQSPGQPPHPTRQEPATLAAA